MVWIGGFWWFELAVCGGVGVYTAFRLPLSGYFSGSASVQGATGYWWSATRYDATGMYLLRAYTTYISPSSIDYRYYGFPLRCVLGS